MIEALRLLPLLLLAGFLLAAAGAFAIVRAALRPQSKGFAHCLAHQLPVEPADLQTTGHERTLPLASPDTTRAWDLQGKNPAGPAVLFVHGHSSSRYQALAMVAPLLPAASRVVTFDLPGHGDAQGPNQTTLRSTLGVREPDDIAAVVQHLRAELPDDTPLILFGVSMGAQSALAAAAQPHTQPQVDGLILLGAYRTFGEPIPGHLRRQKLPVWMFLPPALAWLRLRLGPAMRFDRTQDAQQLQIPLLIVHGERDDLCPLASAQALHHAAQQPPQPNPDAQLVVFPDGGHTRLFQSHPDLYAQSLMNFLNRFQTAHPKPEPTPQTTA